MPSSPKEQVRPTERLQQLYRSVLDSALDCIITMDSSGNVIEFNPAAEHVFGYTRAEAVGRQLADLIIPERMRERHREGLARYLDTGVGPVLGKRIELAGLRKDGSEILVELAITVAQFDHEPVFTAYLRNVTAQRRDEQASRHLAAIVETSGDAIISKDLNGIVTSWNAAAESLFGYRADEMVHKLITTIIPPERSNEEQRIIERIRRGERVDHYETMRRRKDGSLVNVSLSVSPIKDAHGTVVGASKIARDITPQVRDDRRRLAQYTIASLLAGSWTLDEASVSVLQTIAAVDEWDLSAIWLVDDDAKTLRCKSIWHRDTSELEKFAEVSRSMHFTKGKGLPGRVWESEQPAWIRDVTVDPNFPRASAAAEAKLRGGFAFPLFTGSVVNGVMEVFGRETAEPDPDLLKLVESLGSQVGLFIERRHIENELELERKRAVEANVAKDRFLAMLSHELRTPLTPVLIWAGAIADQADLSPEIKEGLEMICRNIDLEARLIDDLLDLTRIARGKLTLQITRADAHDLVLHAIDIVRSELKDRQCTLSVSLEAQSHTVMVDPSRLQQVFWNILRNACKFSSGGGAISVRSSNPAPDKLLVEISDKGVGIEPGNLDKIFNAFEQLETRREGLGLGLSISKAIIDMHGGSIRAESEGVGKGATFVIELPLSKT
jgi:PAS domain S-box-containing protein